MAKRVTIDDVIRIDYDKAHRAITDFIKWFLEDTGLKGFVIV
jgi:hypothetical protein